MFDFLFALIGMVLWALGTFIDILLSLGFALLDLLFSPIGGAMALGAIVMVIFL